MEVCLMVGVRIIRIGMLTSLLWIGFPTLIFGQSGPGGIGANDGSSGLDLWLKGNDGVSTSSGNVTGWNDQSGNSRNFSGGSKEPSLNSSAINGYDAIDFEGNGDELNDSDGNNYINGLGGFTVFFVIESDQKNVDKGLLDTESSHDGTDNVLTTRYDASGWDGGENKVIKCGILNDDADHRIESTKNEQTKNSQLLTLQWNSGNPLELFIDGGSSNSLSNSSNNPTGSISNASNVTIGKGSMDGSNSSWDGLIGEVIIFNKQLDKVERIIAHNYLSAKYDITLSGNDHYAGDKDGNGDYDRRVIGIGQASGNTHTNSKADGLQIQTNTGLDNNGEYMMAGHNVPSNSVNNSDLGGVSGLDSRWERAWYMDETDNNSNLAVDLTFDLSEGGFPSASGGNASDYVLLHRDAGINSGGWSSAGNADKVENGDEIVFQGITIQDGHEYTLGTTNESNSPLPVELLHFDAFQKNGNVVLKWATASETNNSHFIIQKRVDEQWKRIDKVIGHGTTTKKWEYQSVDNRIRKEGTHYYRIKQVDFDGKYEYSDIKSVHIAKSTSASLSLYPVPASDVLNLEVFVDQPQTMQLLIRNMERQVVYRKTQAFPQGRSLETIPLTAFEPGAYLVQIPELGKDYQQRFIKQH